MGSSIRMIIENGASEERSDDMSESEAWRSVQWRSLQGDEGRTGTHAPTNYQ